MLKEVWSPSCVFRGRWKWGGSCLNILPWFLVKTGAAAAQYINGHGCVVLHVT